MPGRQAWLLVLLASCSAEAPQDAVSPFSRLADPGGCVIERITSGDHDEYQVLSVSPDGNMLLMAGRPEGAGDGDTVYESYEIDLATGARTDLSHVLRIAGPYSPDGRFVVVAQDTDNGKTDIFEYIEVFYNRSRRHSALDYLSPASLEHLCLA